MRIGVLEDDIVIRGTLSEMLEYAGHVPKVYIDGWDLLSELIEDEQTPKPDVFDVVLIDLALPSIPGIQVIHTISTIYPTLPIIIVSASTIEYLEAIRRRYPKVRFLQKPFKLQELLTLIQQ